MKKKEKGITLVALVVTIVILLILAGITINLILGPNSIFEMAKKAGEETNRAVENEMAMLNELASYFNEQSWGNSTGGNTGGGTEENPNPGGNTENPNPPTPEKPTTGPNGKPLVGTITTPNNTQNIETEDKSGNPITIPAGFTVVPNGGTDAASKVTYNYNGDGTPAVQDGIVIQDNEGNQFVWIPVGDVKNKDGTTTNITLGRYTFDSSGTPTLEQDSANHTQTVSIYNAFQELVSPSGNTGAKNLGEFITKTKARRRILFSKI